MTFVVELVDDELCIEPIHRLADLPTGIDLRARLGDAFDLRDAGPNTPDGVDALEAAMHADHGLGIVDGRGLALAVPRAEVRAAALADEHPAVADTDTAVVEAMVVPRLAEATWQYRHDARAVAALVDKGDRQRGDPVPARVGRADPRRGRRPCADAAEDDVLLTQAPYRDGVPHVGLTSGGDPASGSAHRPGRRRAEQRRQVARTRALGRRRELVLHRLP